MRRKTEYLLAAATMAVWALCYLGCGAGGVGTVQSSDLVTTIEDPIQRTLNEIAALKDEITRNEALVEQKIAGLKQSNPLFADKDAFESDMEYLERMSRVMPQFDRLRKQYLGDLWKKIGVLRGRMFETNNIIVTLAKERYDPNNETWPIVVKHNEYQKEKFEITLYIAREKANELYKNWDIVQKIGILTIDTGDRIGLAKFQLEDSISGFEFIHEFRPMSAFKYNVHYRYGKESKINCIFATAFSSNGRYFSTGGIPVKYNDTTKEAVRIYDLVKNELHRRLLFDCENGYRCNTIKSVSFSPDSRLLAIGSASGRIRIIDIAKSGFITHVVNSFLISGKVELKSRRDDKLLAVESISFSPDGKFIIVGTENSVKIFNLDTGVEVIEFNGNASSIALSPDGKLLATSSGKVYNTETRKNVYSFHEGNSVAFSPDGEYLAISGNRSKHYDPVTIYRLDSRKKFKSFLMEKTCYAVKFSPNGKYLAFSHDGIQLYDINTGERVRNFNGHGSIDFSSDGKYISTVYGQEARIYRTLLQVEEEVLAQKAISRPPSITASVCFVEPSGNRFLDAFEKGNFILTLKNEGQGPGKGILVKITPERIAHLNYNNTYIEEIAPGRSVTVDIPVEAYVGVADGDHTFRFDFEEVNGFPPAPVEIQFATRAFLKPEMFIVDVGIEDGNGNGMIESGEMINLTVRVGNKGRGTAKSAYAKFYAGDDVFITESHPKTVKLGELTFNASLDIPLQFFVNDRTDNDIPMYFDLTEETNLATVSKIRVPIRKNERIRRIRKTVVSGVEQDYGELAFGKDLSIDIESDIPETDQNKDNALAIIFGIEEYRNVSPVTYAKRDAYFVKEYFEKVLGIPQSCIYFRTDNEVGKAEFDKVFSKGGWLDKRIEKKITEVYIYYAGHGAPDLKADKAYLIPFDSDPNYASITGFEVEKLYKGLADLGAKSVTVFLDACFSGANRENEILLADARPVRIEVRSPALKSNLTVFSAASSNEISSAWPEKKHGLFSYFLMKGMRGDADTDGDSRLTVGELADYIKANVSKTATFLNREQTPVMQSRDKERVLVKY